MPILAVFPGHLCGALKTAAVAQLQGARCDGMAHAISSFVQRRTPHAAGGSQMRFSGLDLQSQGFALQSLDFDQCTAGGIH